MKKTRLKEDFGTLFFFKKIKFEKIHNRQPPGTGSITVNSWVALIKLTEITQQLLPVLFKKKRKDIKNNWQTKFDSLLMCFLQSSSQRHRIAQNLANSRQSFKSQSLSAKLPDQNNQHTKNIQKMWTNDQLMTSHHSLSTHYLISSLTQADNVSNFLDYVHHNGE